MHPDNKEKITHLEEAANAAKGRLSSSQPIY